MKMEHGKPGLALLIAEKAKPKGKDDGDGALEAMKGFLAAVEDGDAEGALDEFRNLMALCEDEGEE